MSRMVGEKPMLGRCNFCDERVTGHPENGVNCPDCGSTDIRWGV